MDIFYAVLSVLAVVGLFLLATGVGLAGASLWALYDALTSNSSKSIPIIGLAYHKDQVFKVELKDSETESDEE